MAHIRLIPTFSNKAARTGVCYVSGRPPQRDSSGERREPVLDLDTNISQEGNLEISLDTAREIAGVIGWISQEVADGYESELSSLQADVARLSTLLDEQKEATSVLAREIAGAAQATVEARKVAESK